MKRNVKTFSVTMEPELYEALQQEARVRDLSFSQLVRKWLRRMAEEEGVEIRERKAG